MAGTNVPDSASTSSSNPTNQGAASRKDQKSANEADKVKEIQKSDVSIATALGTLTATMVAPKTHGADFYRNGKYKPLMNIPTYEIAPREFAPIDFKNKPSSIRIWGKTKGETVFSDVIPAYSKFILESVQESHVERSQIVETFGDFYVFLFGERPPVYNFSGQLINSMYTNWVNDFTFLYENYMRGTKCVESNATAMITYGGRQVDGLILNMSTTTNAAVEGAVGLQFSVVVFERRFFNFSEDMGYSTADDKSLIVDEAFRKVLDEIAGPEGKNMSRPEVSKANEAAKNTLEKGAPASGVTQTSSADRTMSA